MTMFSVNAKQIAYVRYDDQASQMLIQYHTGETRICPGIRIEEIHRLIQSCNPYDRLMRLAQRAQISHRSEVETQACNN